MARVEDDFLNRKLEHIIRDYESGCSMGQKRADRTDRIRTWNVTVGAAYLAYVMTQGCGAIGASLLPLAVIIFLFWIMDAFTGSLGRLNVAFRIEKVDKLLCKKTQKEFQDAIKDHKFLSEWNHENKCWGKHGRLDRFARAFWNCQTLVFYVAPLIVLSYHLFCKERSFGFWCLYALILLALVAMILLQWKLNFCERTCKKIWSKVTWLWRKARNLPKITRGAMKYPKKILEDRKNCKNGSDSVEKGEGEKPNP
ncbi:MAG: hypothetical protein JW741_25690 [Sedimentisphaerales bacterium]|nr:hypothetical protein [Sedimentisphaerales bacterium]